MTEREKIAARIRALLAKTVENGCTEDEAIAAAEKAAEMLARYNLTVDEVQMRASPFEHEAHPFGEMVGDRVWRVAAAIADLTNTRYWSSAPGARPVMMNFFGFAHEVEVAAYMLDICGGAMARERDRLLDGGGLIAYAKLRRRAMPYLDGMADRLAQRIRAMRPTRPTGTGLVVLHDALVLAAMADAGLKTKERAARSSRDLEQGYQDGRAAGDRVALNRGVATRAAAGFLA